MADIADALGRPGRVPQVLVYCPIPYNGRGLATSCVRIVDNMPRDVIEPRLFISRTTAPISDDLEVVEASPRGLRRIPWVLSRYLILALLNWRFSKAIASADPATTVAYFWPDPPRRLLMQARKRGLPIVRQMVNCTRDQSRRILDPLYRQEGMKPTHGITRRSARRESRDLRLYDRIFCSEQVISGLMDAGVVEAAVVQTTSGWSGRYLGDRASSRRSSDQVVFLFVGIVCLRKGVVQLLRAWSLSGAPGLLRIAGGRTPEIKAVLERYGRLGSVEFVDFTDDVGALYADADVFVFPTFEEGGPKVTYEAAGCGLPVVTTPMGAGQIIKDRVNGLVVPPGDVQALAAAIRMLAHSAEARRVYGARARADAARFSYEAVARDRAVKLAGALGAPNRAGAGEMAELDWRGAADEAPRAAA